MPQGIYNHYKKRIRISSSIENFKSKLMIRTKLREYGLLDIFNPTLFIGLYHTFDCLRFLTHRGRRKMFFCGSDILYLEKSLWRYIIPKLKSNFYCENEVEQEALRKLDIKSEIHPMIFDDPDKYQICYKHSDNPRVFGVYHKGREKEYGLFEHPQVDWLCGLSEKEFNEKIKEYQGCIRLNQFDGFAETLAKSVLMGQYQYSVIPYKYMTTTQTLEQWLQDLKNKKEPNFEAANYWCKKLSESLCEVLS